MTDEADIKPRLLLLAPPNLSFNLGSIVANPLDCSLDVSGRYAQLFRLVIDLIFLPAGNRSTILRATFRLVVCRADLLLEEARTSPRTIMLLL